MCSPFIWNGIFFLCDRCVMNLPNEWKKNSINYIILLFFISVIVLQLVSSSIEPELKYQSIIRGVRHYINHKKLPDRLKEKLLHFYEHRFQGSLFKEKAITSTLSSESSNRINIFFMSHLFIYFFCRSIETRNHSAQ